jgi:hypothetical protein
MKKRRLLFQVGSALVVAVFLAYIAFDVQFVNKSVTERRGYGFSSLDESKSLQEKLGELGVPYSVEQSDGHVQIWWDKKYGQVALPRQSLAGQLLDEDVEELCFQKHSKPAFDSLVTRLEDSAVPFTTHEEDSEYCARWDRKHDSTVQQIYPNLKEIREIEAGREK